MATPEPSDFYGDARDNDLTSAENKKNNALMHFNFFLKTYCVQIGIAIVEATAIPYRGMPRQASNKKVFEWWDRLIGAFFTYMGTKATIYCDPTRRRLAYQTATGYASSIKVYLCNKFRNETPIPVFQEQQWKKLRAKLRGMYRESNRAAGKPMTESKETSTREDREAMATGAIWLGTTTGAEYWHLLNTSYMLSGRGSEVALIRPEWISSIEVNEDVYSYKTLQNDIQRVKDGPFQSISVYLHRDSVLECYFFSLIHLIVMNGSDNEFVFPSFAKAALKTKSNKSDSQVSTVWTSRFEEIRNTFESLSERINERLSSHSPRRSSNQAMAECHSVSGVAQIFRTGWELRGCDTLFEYLVGSAKLSSQAGKSLSLWTTKIGDLIVGGQCPTLDDIEEHRDELKAFINILFEDDTTGRWSPSVREMLVMVLLIRYQDFCKIVESQPTESQPRDPLDPTLPNNSQGRNSHLFIGRVLTALERVNARRYFASWQRDAKRAFLVRNMPAIPIEKFSLYGGEDSDILMDPRTFVDHFNALASVTQATHQTVLQLRHKIADIHHRLDTRANDSWMLQTLMNVNESVRRLERHLIGSESRSCLVTAKSKPSNVLAFSITSKALDTGCPISDISWDSLNSTVESASLK